MDRTCHKPEPWMGKVDLLTIECNKHKTTTLLPHPSAWGSIPNPLSFQQPDGTGRVRISNNIRLAH